jgi:hypothetical protein
MDNAMDRDSKRKFDPWIRGFFKPVAYRKPGEMKVSVLVEEKVHPNDEKTRDVDIVISLDSGGKDRHILAIENKIREESCEPTQLLEEYQGLLNEYEGANISMLYLTPRKSSKSDEALKRLPPDVTRLHMTWAEGGESSFVGILRGILREDAEARIPPLSQEVKFVVKSLVQFAENGFKPQTDRDTPTATDLGTPYYRGVVIGLEELRALFKERKDIYVGFYGGPSALEKANLGDLQDRRFKWDDKVAGRKVEANWIPVREFLRIVEEKEKASAPD